MENCEYSNFKFITDKLRFDPTKIKLLTKINNGTHKPELLSIVWYTIDNQLYAYGHNAAGCLGLNTVALMVKKASKIQGLDGIQLIKLCSGQRFVLALTENGQCYSWGDNRFGQLGLGKSTTFIIKPFLLNSIEEQIADISCGLHHSLVLTISHNLYSFGSNLTGALGNGSNFHQIKPYKLTNLVNYGTDIVEISAGGWHSAAVNLKGELFVWGFNQTCQCGNEDYKSNLLLPRRVTYSAITPFLVQTVRCGKHHTLVLCFNGQVLAIGSNEQGQCGQDVDQFPFCPTPVLVDLDEPVSEIGAWAKSNISVARSATSGAFFLWGEIASTAEDDIRKHKVRKIPLDTVSILDPHLTINWLLSKFEVTQYADDNKRLASNEDFAFPLKRIFINIVEQNEPETYSNDLMENFNHPTECDLILSFGTDQLSASKGWKIFVNQQFLKHNSEFFKYLPKFWIIEAEKSNNKSQKNIEKEIEIQSNLEQNDDSDDHQIKFQTSTLTINQQRKRFQKILLNNSLVSQRALYAYLFSIYSINKYLIIGEKDLIEFLRIAEIMNSNDLIDACLHYAVSNTPNNLQQLCFIHGQAVKYGLKTVESLCYQTMLTILQENSEKDELLSKLFCEREETFNVQLEFKNQTIKCHKLILLVCSNFYYAFPSTSIAKEIINNGMTQKDLMKLNKIELNDICDFHTFDLYISHIYNGQFPYVLAIEELVKLYHLTDTFDEIKIQEEILSVLRSKLTEENLCQFYSQYCNISNDLGIIIRDPLKEICLEIASNNLVKLITGPDFHCLLLDNDLLKNFFIDLSKYLKKLRRNNN